MNKNEEFVKSLYDELDERINETYKKKKESRDELLKAIAMILLSYTIVDNVLSLSEKDYNKEYSLLGALIIKLTRGNIKQETSNTTSILKNTIKNTYDHYSYNYNLKDVKKIIDSNFKGKHFSDRIWNNEKEVAKKLTKQCQDFLKGKINVNHIETEIKKTFNSSAYNAKRLVETEVSRCHNQAFDRFCREVGVKKVRYNAIFDKRTCSECADYDGEVFDFNKKLDLPMHPLCRCFYEIVDDDKKEPFVMNLQLFAMRSNWNILKSQIDSGTLSKYEARNGMKYWKKVTSTKLGTPIEVIKPSRKTIDQYWHILEDHKEFLEPREINNIIDCLLNPDEIRLSFGKNVYIKNINGKDLLVIVNNDIITAYYPNRRYLNNNIRRKILLWQKW